jgi:hypothetical protein
MLAEMPTVSALRVLDFAGVKFLTAGLMKVQIFWHVNAVSTGK